MKIAHYILAAVSLALLAHLAPAGQDAATTRRPAAGSIEAQLRLKAQLKAESEGMTLAAAIRHNRQEWNNLSGDERDAYRRNVLAFLRKDPAEQEKLVKHYDSLVKLPPAKREEYRRYAKWVKSVVDELSPQERQMLLTIPPADRAKWLTQKHAELTTQPAGQ